MSAKQLRSRIFFGFGLIIIAVSLLIWGIDDTTYLSVLVSFVLVLVGATTLGFVFGICHERYQEERQAKFSSGGGL